LIKLEEISHYLIEKFEFHEIYWVEIKFEGYETRLTCSWIWHRLI